MTGLHARLKGMLAGFALDVTFAAGEGVTALFGPSGSGKTSVLRCVAGLARVPGEVRVEGETWQDTRLFLPAHRRRVAYVFQGANLLPHLSVAANLAYAARRAGRERLDEAILAATGVDGLLARNPATLSGGEAQRVAITRALTMRPRLLLLDEPFSALDGEAKEELLRLLERLLPTLRLPVLFVSHDAAEVARLARRRIMMRGGRIDTVEALSPPPG